MTEILILKTAALGDVMRTTSLLPGLCASHEHPRITWFTARGAADLVRTHPLVTRVVTADVSDARSLSAARSELGEKRWDRVISLDDEEPLCALASALSTARLSGAWLRPDGARAYTEDVGPWFDMGLLSVHGKAEADRRKLANTKSHGRIQAQMLGIPESRPMLWLPEASRARAQRFAHAHGLAPATTLVGLNTGAGGRWTSKQLSVERTVELAELLDRLLERRARFLVLGGRDEEGRNAAIRAGLARAGLGDRAVDAGTDNALLDFAALIELCRVVVASDSLALHLAVAQGVPAVAFFAPTSGAEIELYGRGEKVLSTAPDYASYRPDADNSSITPGRLAEAVLRQLGTPAAAHSTTAPIV